LPSTRAEYLVDPGWGPERERLSLLELCLDPWTVGQLERTGIAPGWACLELGAGRGSVARWLHARAGHVVAADLDTRFLEVPPGDGFDVRIMDLRIEEFPPASFDLIHCRYLLTHLGPRTPVLTRMLRWLRPGGWLVVEEPEMFAAAVSEHCLWARWWQVLGGLGAMDLTCGRALAREIREAGAVEVDMEVHVMTARGGNTAAAFHRLSVLASRDFLVPMGLMSGEELDELAEALLDPAFLEPAGAVVSVRARKGELRER
jgi:SAM-dependent methyltransferase